MAVVILSNVKIHVLSACKEVSEMVNQAILNSHEQILNKYVHQECPHKSTDMTSLRGT